MNISQLICLARKRPRAATPNRRLSLRPVTKKEGSSVLGTRLQNRRFLTRPSPIDRHVKTGSPRRARP